MKLYNTRGYVVEPVEQTAVESKPVSAPTVSEPRNFLVAFLLAGSFGVLGLRHFYLGNNKLGWTRTGLFVGGYAWVFLMLALSQFSLTILGILAVMVAGVWAIVDFFYVYNAVKTDADGQALTVTKRDKKWAKVIYIVMIAAVALSIALWVVGATFAENSFKSYFNNPNSLNQDLNDDAYQLPQQSY